MPKRPLFRLSVNCFALTGFLTCQFKFETKQLWEITKEKRRRMACAASLHFHLFCMHTYENPKWRTGGERLTAELRKCFVCLFV